MFLDAEKAFDHLDCPNLFVVLEEKKEFRSKFDTNDKDTMYQSISEDSNKHIYFILFFPCHVALISAVPCPHFSMAVEPLEIAFRTDTVLCL